MDSRRKELTSGCEAVREPIKKIQELMRVNESKLFGKPKTTTFRLAPTCATQTSLETDNLRFLMCSNNLFKRRAGLNVSTQVFSESACLWTLCPTVRAILLASVVFFIFVSLLCFFDFEKRRKGRRRIEDEAKDGHCIELRRTA